MSVMTAANGYPPEALIQHFRARARFWYQTKGCTHTELVARQCTLLRAYERMIDACDHMAERAAAAEEALDVLFDPQGAIVKATGGSDAN